MNEHAEPKQLVWTPDLVRKFWDYRSRFPEEYFTNQFGAQIVATLSRHLRGRARLLDFGCGTGYLMDHLLAAGHHVTGLDFSKATVDSVNERLSGRPGFGGAFLPEELAERGEKFDAVICCEVVEHLYDDDLEASLCLIRSLCHDGGIAAFTTPNREDMRVHEVYCPVSNLVFHRWQHVRTWDRHSLSEWLARHGLRVVDAREVDFSGSLRLAPRRWLATKAKVALGRRAGLPHLCCVAVAEPSGVRG